MFSVHQTWHTVWTSHYDNQRLNVFFRNSECSVHDLIKEAGRHETFLALRGDDNGNVTGIVPPPRYYYSLRKSLKQAISFSVVPLKIPLPVCFNANNMEEGGGRRSILPPPSPLPKWVASKRLGLLILCSQSTSPSVVPSSASLGLNYISEMEKDGWSPSPS